MRKFMRLLFFLAVSALACLAAPAATRVVLLADGQLDPPAEYGLERLVESLRAKGVSVERGTSVPVSSADFIVLAGRSSAAQVAGVLKAARIPLAEGPQALVIRRSTVQGKPAVVLCGSDARGLMYAALDTADRVSWSSNPRDPFSYVRDTSEKPYLLERGISIYTMHRAYFENRLYSEAYWKRYFDLLARSRINAFTVIFGYENGGFMAPPYPYFFDVEAHPQVRLVGITREQQARNVRAFRAMIRIAHQRGIEVIPAIWDHIYRGGVQGLGSVLVTELPKAIAMLERLSMSLDEYVSLAQPTPTGTGETTSSTPLPPGEMQRGGESADSVQPPSTPKPPTQGDDHVAG
jgi:hypothetical protein